MSKHANLAIDLSQDLFFIDEKFRKVEQSSKLTHEGVFDEIVEIDNLFCVLRARSITASSMSR